MLESYEDLQKLKREVTALLNTTQRTLEETSSKIEEVRGDVLKARDTVVVAENVVIENKKTLETFITDFREHFKEEVKKDKYVYSPSLNLTQEELNSSFNSSLNSTKDSVENLTSVITEKADKKYVDESIGVYSTTAQGIQHTANGDYFKVLVTDSNEVNEKLYKNVNNTAVDQEKDYPTSQAKWEDSQLKTWSGLSQEFENKLMSKTRLGQKILYETPSLNIDIDTHKYPQGGCKVGDSLFIKIATNEGTVGLSTEAFIIAEYNFKTGVLVSQTLPMETLGHHELSGFIKDGKTYLVTSYQPLSADGSGKSGVGISIIEWNGSSTTLSNVKQYELLDTTQYIGYPAIDQNGEYVYISNSKYGASTGSGELKRAPILNIQVHKLSEIESGIKLPLYNFNIANPVGDGLIGSSSLNGLSATKDHIYAVFGGAYGNAEIHKYTVNGDFVEKILTSHSRGARPQSQIVNNETFLYNTEPEGFFTDNGKMYLVCAEYWCGTQSFVKFNNRFYLARYSMTGKSPASHVDHWIQVDFTPTTWSDYSATESYLGRDATKGRFVRTVVEIGLKDNSNYDLLMSTSVGTIPNMIGNIADRVHVYGCLQTSPELNFGMYDYQRQTFQKNITMDANGIKLFDTRYLASLNDKSSSVRAYQGGATSLLSMYSNDSYQADRFTLYGRFHGSTDESTQHAYLASLYSDGAATATFYRDGRFYNYSKNATNSAKFFLNGVELLGVYGSSTALQIDTANTYTWFGKSSNGVHSSATIGMNHETKSLMPPADEASSLGWSSQRFKESFIVKRYYTATVFDAYGEGSPEGVLTGRVGSTYRRTDGGTSTTFYVKESGTGNTGWIAK